MGRRREGWREGGREITNNVCPAMIVDVQLKPGSYF